MMPNSVAALVEPAAPSGSKVCSDPIGARMAGMRSFWPRKVVDGSTCRDVDEDTRPERDLVEGEPVPPQRRLRLRAADQVVPGALLQLPTRLLDDLLVADDVPHLLLSTQEWGVAL